MKHPILRLLIIFFILELPFALFVNHSVNIGTHPESGTFKVWLEKKNVTIGQQIQEEFQPDKTAWEIQEKTGEEPSILGSKKIHHFFVMVFGPNSAISTFHLLKMILIVDIILVFLAFWIRSQIRKVPSKRQIVFELFHGFFEDLVKETLGPSRLHLTPYFLSIFLFIWTCNLIGLIPIPGFSEPTRNLNVPLGMGLMAVFFVHFMSIKHKGFIAWVKNFMHPIFIMAPLNIIGEVSKAVSISFRLFGNLMGGAIIALVISSLVHYLVLPVGLNMFFGLFAGTIQAFVFTMLSLTYLAVEIGE